MYHDCMYSPNPVIEEIANRTGRSIYQVTLRWVHQKGIVSIFGSSVLEQQKENLASLDGPDLSPEDMAKIDALDRNRPIFFSPEATEQTVRN